MFSPASDRNKQPILDQLIGVLPSAGKVLEIACGSLQHAIHFATALPSIRWYPTDINPQALSNGATLEELPANLARPTFLDATELPWQQSHFDIIYTANLLHISPSETSSALFRGAQETVDKDGLVIIYGPFKIAGQHTSPSNQAFDEDLRSRNPAWGIRDRETIEDEARSAGFKLHKAVAMPANNFLLVFNRLSG